MEATTKLLPQYAESLQQSRREALQRVQTSFLQVQVAIKQIATNIGQALQRVWLALQPALRNLTRILRPYIDTKHTRRSQRSTRRGKVQAKRHALGLPVNGKLPGLSRKESYALKLALIVMC